MRHPFDGIIIPETETKQPPAGELHAWCPSRRSALRWLASLPGALFGLGAARAALGQGFAPRRPQSDSPPVDDRSAETPLYGLYFVVPDDVRALPARQRQELNILGKLLHGWPSRDELRRTASFSASKPSGAGAFRAWSRTT